MPPDADLSEAELLAAAGEDLALYTSLAYPNFRMAPHHQRMIEALEDVANGRCKRLIISMPPRMGKSLITSEHFPAWYLGRNPSHYVISATYGQELASDFGLKVRNQVGDPLFQAIWPGVTLTAESASAKKFRTPQGGIYVAVGRGGALTGRGAHLLLIDDPYKNMAEADSAAIRRSVQGFYGSAAYTRLMPGGAIVLIQTRWRDDDLAGWLLKEHRHEGWRLLELPAIDAAGQALWPEAYPIEALRRIRRTLSTREWQALYQQRPYAEEGAIIKRHWWRPWTAPKPARPDLVLISADTAMTADADNDATGVTIWHVCPDESERSCALLVGALRERLEFNDLVEAIEEAERTFSVRGVPTRVLVENKANGLPLIQELRRRKPHLNIFQAKAVGDKVARAHSVTALFQHEPADGIAGRVYALARMEGVDAENPAGPQEAVFRPWAQMVIDECSSFPLGAHDDLCLAAGTLVRMADGSERPIEHVAVGDTVATPGGQALVTAAGMTGRRVTWMLESSDGRRLEGTGSHPVMADDDWTPIATLMIGSRLQVEPKWPWQRNAIQAFPARSSSTAGIAIDGIQTAPRQPIGATLPGPASCCTGPSGKMRTDLYRRGTTSITGTVSRLTTALRTFAASWEHSTGRNIVTSALRWASALSNWSICKGSETLLRHGIALTRAKSGIGRMPSSAASAQRSTDRPWWSKACGLASGAARSSSSSQPARLSAPLAVSIKDLLTSRVEAVWCTRTTKPVFNLTVEGAHCFFANRILVHNCDSVTHGLRHLRQIGVEFFAEDESPPPPRVPRGPKY